MTTMQQSDPSFPITIAPELTRPGGSHVSRGIGTMVTVNKGTTFRLILNKMIEQRRLQQMTETPIVFIVGDSPADMTMLRPDLEAEVYGPVNRDSCQ